MKFFRFLKLKVKDSGAILIEFAFAIPILSLTLFFMTDAPRYYYIKAKMHNSTHFAANMIQNISQFKSDKRISSTDLSRIFCAAFINQYSGVQLYATGSNVYPLGYSFSAYVYYVECYDDSNKARVVWAWHNVDVSEPEKYEYEILEGNHTDSIVTYSATTPSSIYRKGTEELTMEKGDAKIIIEVALVPKGSSTGDDKSRFGFLMMPIKPSVGSSYFNTVVVITPNPGLFDETPPTYDESSDDE